MKNLMTVGASLMLTTTAATAGGIDRGGNAYSVMFEDGNYVELSFSKATPEVTGDYAGPLVAFGATTENMAESYTSFGVALKYAVNDQLDVGLFLNQPYGANAAYTAGAFTGIAADWESNQIAVVLKYQVNDNVSVMGGVRSVESQAEITLPDPGAGTVYTANTDANRQNGFIVGAAYERPEIAMRVALTYESGMTHDFATTEAINGVTVLESTTDIEMPKSLTLDFQSGVAADTLVFGSIRWSEWSVWEVRPAAYAAANAGDRITGLDNDVTTFRLGVGRKINDNLSVFGRVTYEEANGGSASLLSPTDGSTSIGLGGSYTMDGTKITAGVEYAMLGDATHEDSGTTFTDNTALGFGVSVGFSF